MILIVDDKPENLFSLQKTLASDGLQSETASSGEEALKKVLRTDYELVILDVQMPGMDGFEVAESLTGFNKTKDIPIIFLSAASKDKKYIAKGFNSGGVDYVTKPADPDILLLKVKNFIRLYRQTRELRELHATLEAEVMVRREAQEVAALRARELNAALDALPQLAYISAADGQLEFTNRAWKDFSQDEQLFPKTIDGEAHLQDIWNQTVSGKQMLEQEVKLLSHRTGKASFFLWRGAPVGEEVSSKWVGTFTDIQHQKSVNELLEDKVKERTTELEESNQALAESNHDLQQFASVASHDLKEPLRKIQIFSNLLSERMPEGSDTSLKDYLKRIVASSRRMNMLINDLLRFSKLSSSAHFEPINLSQLIPEIISDLEVQITEKDAVVNFSGLPVIEAIPGQMRQIFQNLISNAIKFSKVGEPPVINIQGVVDKDMVSITVSDNGIGFEEMYLEKIFIIFQRLHAKDDYEGTGIGLAIARKIVQRHNGTITASSKPGEGAAFILSLPLKQQDRHETLPAAIWP